jgi:hypothetical protein
MFEVESKMNIELWAHDDAQPSRQKAPAGQAKQTELPLLVLYVPAGQARHEDLPVKAL